VDAFEKKIEEVLLVRLQVEQIHGKMLME